MKKICFILSMAAVAMMVVFSACKKNPGRPLGVPEDVAAFGEIFINCGDDLALTTSQEESNEIINDFLRKIKDTEADTNTTLDTPDRKYLIDCINYFFKCTNRHAIELEGLNPDDESIKADLNKANEQINEQVTKMVNNAHTLGDIADKFVTL